MLQRNIAQMMLVLSPPLVWLTYLEFFVHAGANVGIRQTGDEPLTLIIAYPLPGHPRLKGE